MAPVSIEQLALPAAFGVVALNPPLAAQVAHAGVVQVPGKAPRGGGWVVRHGVGHPVLRGWRAAE